MSGLAATLASFILGAALIGVFEPTAVRALGALFLIASIASGVRLIATPSFLAGDEAPHDEDR